MTIAGAVNEGIEQMDRIDIISTSPVTMLANVVAAVEQELEARKERPAPDHTQRTLRDRYIEQKTFEDTIAFLKKLRALTPEEPHGGYCRDVQSLIELEISSAPGPGSFRRVWMNIDGVCYLRVMVGPKCASKINTTALQVSSDDPGRSVTSDTEMAGEGD